MSNFEIEKWVKQLGIKNFRGVFSRNSLPKSPLKNECGIVNLDDSKGPGTHWISYFNNYYFDPFGLLPPKELIRYIPSLKYSTIQYQDKLSLLCGYFCLFFIKMLQDNVHIYDLLYKLLDINNSIQNEQTIINYFKQTTA